ncbi:MAG TPA: Crp/Fnr family transcriptional regulator [Candidatus Elarobacter sp.]|nr:Crp/Fnr family transcriptional regulator [Candidatus Elarobacter sp.]
MKAGPMAYEGGNRLLDAIPSDERAEVVRPVEVVGLDSGTVTHAPDVAYDWVVFPIDAVLSVVTTLSDGETAEVGTVGNEGASGAEIAFGAPVLRKTICQVEGRIARMPTLAFLDAVDRSAGLDALIRSTEKARMFFVEQMIVCNTVHKLEQRCARWLLLVADRAAREEYRLTHDFLSIMLGVRRATVSEAAKSLHDAGAIEYARGRVRILDRAILESQSCECYKLAARVFDAALDTWGVALLGRKRRA